MTFAKEVIGDIFSSRVPMRVRLSSAAVCLGFLALVGATVFGALVVGVGPAVAALSLLLIGGYFWYFD